MSCQFKCDCCGKPPEDDPTRDTRPDTWFRFDVDGYLIHFCDPCWLETDAEQIRDAFVAEVQRQQSKRLQE